MKVHLYTLANPEKPEDACSVPDCKNQATHWWPFMKVALCQFHYEFPTTKYKGLVEESRIESQQNDFEPYY